MTVKVIIGGFVALALLSVGCGALLTSGTPTSVPQPTVAVSITPALASPVASSLPRPNPLPALSPGGNKDYAATTGADVAAYGAAATIHGAVGAGQAVFAQNCQQCHSVEGKGGVTNPNSDDGTVPPLNPIDPTFKAIAKGDPAIFAGGLDLFIQHGSRPAGSNPVLSMAGWGDQKKLTQQQIADVEAYVMQLNGVTWPSN